MKSISEIPLTLKRTRKYRSERDEYLDIFAARINSARTADGYKHMRVSYFAAKLSHLTIQDLHAFLKSCDAADNFSRCFWGNLKVRTYSEPKVSEKTN